MNVRALARRIPVVRDLVHHVSPYHVGTVFGNRLGYQVLRTLGKNLSLRLKRRPAAGAAALYLDVLDRDGVVAIPNFLPAAVFDQVRAEYDRIRPELVFRPFRDAPEARLEVARVAVSEAPQRFPAMQEHLIHHETIIRLACAVTRTHFTPKPYAELTVYRKASDVAPDNDIENVLHADVHYPTVKAFYYLNDVDEKNGAFVYAKRSHRLTMTRVGHEYDLSIREAKLRAGHADIPQSLIAERGLTRRAIVSPRVMERMGIVESSICGRANTLIVTNNMGFHRRGAFLGSEPRATLLINFRYLGGKPPSSSDPMDR